MHAAYTIATAIIMLSMVLSLVRAFAGPTVFDRIVAANMFATKTVLLIALLGFLTDRPDFFDLAVLYALLSFISIIAVLKFVRYGNADKSEIELEIEDERASR
jgi:multicomponent Na+:H+ antiporter subunit F